MGSELIPGELPPPALIHSILEGVLEDCYGRWEKVGRKLANSEQKFLGKFATRCRRAGLTADDVLNCLVRLQDKYPNGIEDFDQRLDVAWSLISRRWEKERTELVGFKLSSSAIQETSILFPNARFICLIRDPADVLQSQIRRGFKKEPIEIAKAWSAYSNSYHTFAERNPGRCIVLRYEDLVSSPRRSLTEIFSNLPVELDERIFKYYESASPILTGNHPNEERLRTNFSVDSMGNGWKEIGNDLAEMLHKFCGDEMKRNGYAGPGFATFIARRALHHEPASLSQETQLKKRDIFKKRSKYSESDYEALLSPYLSTCKLARLCDYVRMGHEGDQKYLIIRHDIDHDIETARKMGTWEASNGIQSTYCILHTAWYYGDFRDQRYHHSKELIDCVFFLLSLGHEINFHNNLVAMSLHTGVDAFLLLEQELSFFHRLGVPITGTSTHGDRLCRELNFRNWELFKECCDDRFGGPRDVRHVNEVGREVVVPLGQYSMREFGLEYEAYDIARDIYHTDSGGTLRVRNMTRGRRVFGREPGAGQLVGILTHPIWWSFQ